MEATFVPHYKELIQGVAFGDNSGELNNTCSAVALSIALNYLAVRFDECLVPADMRLGSRRLAVGMCLEPPRSPADPHIEPYQLLARRDSSLTNATRFHRYLIEECGLGPVYHLGLTWGVWGSRLKRGFKHYLAKLPKPASAKLSMHWRLGGKRHIIESIERGVPALITTWPGRMRDAGGNVYSWHTMVVYGYRVTENGQVEYCVHSGWLTSKATLTSGVVYQDNIWLTSHAVCMSYWFDVESQV